MLPRVLPVVDVWVGGRAVRALVDTGCSTTVVTPDLVNGCSGSSSMVAFDGREVPCRGMSLAQFVVRGVPISVRAIVADQILDGVDFVMGMDAIEQLGGVTVAGGEVTFGRPRCAVSVKAACESGGGDRREAGVGNRPCEIEDKDFHAEFDGERWTVEWKWKTEEPPVLRNRVSCYERSLSEETRGEFEREVERWIEEGILVPWEEEVKGGVLPLMAVVQATKGKVRPVLDYRELNAHVECHTGDSVADVCGETLRAWRQMNKAATVVDLKSAYLQIHVARSLWKYQLVKVKGKTYCLTRLGFGLSSAPRIMAKILKTVLGKVDRMESGTDSYIDDILVDETVVSAAEVAEHLRAYGLATKPPEPLEGGAALGLKLRRDADGKLTFRRGNEVPELAEHMSRRELFSVCGKLVGHYPIAGWLRVASSFVKRNAEGVGWEDGIGDRAFGMIQDIVRRVKEEDPVRGKWYVPETRQGVLWCDASSIATGVLLEMGDSPVEDAAWLRKKDDYGHINVAELDAVLKGINLALKWGLRDVEVRTDSATVFSWVQSVITSEKRVRTKGAAEMIVKRRLGILSELLSEYGIALRMTLVPSEKNKADVLTRVKRTWLKAPEEPEAKGTRVCCAGALNLREDHSMHHMGVERTLYLARKLDPAITREAVRQVIRGCDRCQSIDPAPIVHEAGEICVNVNWKRLALDVTHYRGKLYLTMVDCGPGRLAIWREIGAETADIIGRVLTGVFLERGPVGEVLMDNSATFRSQGLESMLDKWNVKRCFRAAYRPSGNGIVERHHRTIKALAERGAISPLEAVFWYNMSPRTGQDESSVPQRSVFRYEWRHPRVAPTTDVEEERPGLVQVGEEVWVKPPNARCTTQWGRGRVTAINSRNNVSVDGMPRHILDLRKVVGHSYEVVDNDDREREPQLRSPLADEAPQQLLNAGGLVMLLHGGAGDVGNREEGGRDVGDREEGVRDVGDREEGGGGDLNLASEASDSNGEGEREAAEGRGRPRRVRRPPVWTADFVLGEEEES